MAQVLVTGATGFIGRALATRLAAEGIPLRLLARSVDRLGDLREDAAVIEGDITDPLVLDRAVAGVDTVFHVAGTFREPGLSDERYRAINVDAVSALIAAARRHGVRRVVHTSTVGIHGSIDGPPAVEASPIRPDGIYEITKAEGDRVALATGAEAETPEVVVLRPAPVYGPGDTRLLKLFKLACRPRPVLLGDGRALYQMVHVDDLVQAFLLAARVPGISGQAFIIAGAERPTVQELLGIVARAIGKVDAPRPIRLPGAPVRLLAHACEVICQPFGIKPPLYRRRVDFFLLNRQYDTTKAVRMLGFSPKVPLAEGLRQTAEWYRREGLL